MNDNPEIEFVQVSENSWKVHPDSVDALETKMSDALQKAFGFSLDELRESIADNEV